MDSHRQHILLVEDEAAHAHLIRRAFEAHAPAVELHEVKSLREAQRLLTHLTPDLILADWRLPDGHGTDLLEGGARRPVVILTSQGNEQVAVQALKAGALDYVVKTEQSIVEVPLVAERALRQWQLVTEHEQAQRALRRSEEHYRGLFENANDAIFIVDLSSARILKANPRAAALLGYAADELTRLCIFDLDPPEDRAKIEAILVHIQVEGSAVFEHRLLRKDGSLVDVEISTRRIDYDGEQVLQSFVRDISARKLTETALREREEELRLALEAARMGTWVWDVQTGGVEWSEQVAAIFGIEPGAFDGTYDAYRQLIYPDDVPTVEAAIAEVLGGGETYHVRHRLLRPDGALCWVEARGRLERDADGRPGRLRGTVVDITEREEAEVARRQAEQRYRRLFEDAPLMYIVTENRGGIPHVAACNQRLLETLQRERSEVLGRPLTEFYTEESTRHLLDEGGYKHALSGAFVAAERQLRRRDGGVVETILKAVPERDAEGRVWGTRAMYVDITERKRAEEALRESEMRLREAQRLTLIGTWHWDLRTDAQQWSDEYFRLLGYEPGAVEASYETFVAHVHPDDHAQIAASTERLVRELEDIEEEFRAIRADGEVRVLASVAKLFFDENGAPASLLGAIQDVTEQRQIEEKLREGATRLKEALRLARMGTWGWDLRTDTQEWSEEICEIYGLDPATTLPSFDAFIALVHPDDQAQVLASTSRIRENHVDLTEEFRLVRPDGKVLVLTSAAKLFFDEDGEPIRLLGTIQDVTERREMEAAAMRAQQALLIEQQRAKERVEEELARARDQLVRQTRLATIGQIAASIAHELRNPLGAVRNAVYFLRRRSDHDAKVSEYLGIIEQEVTSANRIITDLLEMSRAKAPERQQVDLRSVLHEAFGKLPGAPKHSLICDLEPEPFRICADAGQLRQVFLNLFLNAAQAIGSAKGRANRRGHVRVSARRTDGFDVITIRDDGPGVPEEQRARIFEPLFSSKAKGTGLGLAICRQIAERHGGSLELILDEAPGAAFELRLPHSRAEQPDDAAQAPGATDRANSTAQPRKVG